MSSGRMEEGLLDGVEESVKLEGSDEKEEKEGIGGGMHVDYRKVGLET